MNAVLSACEKADQWPLALFFLSAMTKEKALRGSVVTYTAAICACERTGHWQHVMELIQDMRVEILKPNAITCGATMNVYELLGFWKETLDLFPELERSVVQLRKRREC